MAGVGIEAPYVVASLPKPLDSANGRTQAAPVYGLSGLKKRKRHEVAVGIDGESMSIYNIQTQNLVVSYSLPPQTSLCCPPYSIYYRNTQSSGAQRRTFLVVKEKPNKSKVRLVSFTEDVRGKRAAGGEFSAPVKRERDIHDGEVIGLGLIPDVLKDQLSIIVNYKDGAVEIVGADLSEADREERSLERSGEYLVEYAAVLDMDTARKGILKSREDIVALLGQSHGPARNFALLCRLVRIGEERQLELYTVRDPVQRALQTSKSTTHLIMSYVLPSRKLSTETAQYDLHFLSGTLYQRLDKKLSIYDLSGIIPKLAAELGHRSAPVFTFLRISSSLVLTVSEHKATIYETKYGSVQATASLATSAVSRAQSKKRKREEATEEEEDDDDDDDDDEQMPVLQAISAFTGLGLAVCLHGHDLTALQFSDASQSNKRRKSHGTLLADVMSKECLREGFTSDRNEKKARKLEDWVANFNTLVDEGDIDGLEKLVANDDKLGKQRRGESWHEAGQPNALPNGDAAAYQDLWPLPERFDPHQVDRRKALFIISKMFDPVKNEDDGLEVRIASTKLLEWLALTGFLTASCIRKAFKLHVSEAAVQEVQVTPGDIMSAIGRIDEDFQLMQDLLSLPVHWEIAEVTQALRLLLQSFDAPPTGPLQLALPAPHGLNGDTDMINGDADSHLELESRAAEHELDHAMRALSTGLEVRSNTLRVIFARLHAFPPQTITRTMRSMMSHAELIFVTHVLRIELADGGWLSKYVDDGGDEERLNSVMMSSSSGLEESGPSDQAIKSIGDLLNCALDAIGMSGWLVGQSGNEGETKELVECLRAEISAGLEGCYQADTVHAYLADLEWYAASSKQVQDGLQNEERDEQGAILPFGARVESGTIKGTNERGGKKSQIAFAREKSRAVGKYSFERIRV